MKKVRITITMEMTDEAYNHKHMRDLKNKMNCGAYQIEAEKEMKAIGVKKVNMKFEQINPEACSQ